MEENKMLRGVIKADLKEIDTLKVEFTNFRKETKIAIDYY